MQKPQIVIASDHAGFTLKELIKSNLTDYEVIDVGTNSENAVSYVEIANNFSKKMLSLDNAKGIIICGTGIGVSIAVNRHKNLRAALCSDVVSAKLTREHNNANVLALGARIIGSLTATEIVNTFLNTPFSNEQRHIQRITEIDA